MPEARFVVNSFSLWVARTHQDTSCSWARQDAPTAEEHCSAIGRQLPFVPSRLPVQRQVMGNCWFISISANSVTSPWDAWEMIHPELGNQLMYWALSQAVQETKRW